MIMNMSAGANIQPVVGKLLSTLNVGDTLEVPVVSDWQSRFGANIVWKVADKNHTGYPANSVTLITEKIIQIMAWDAKEPSNSNSNRRNYGNNRHIYSNLLQWLNSNATAGNWYSAKHSADAPPTNANVYNNCNEYDGWAGFLAMLDSKFVAELLDATLNVVKSSMDGGSYETFTAKMFLASTTEVGLANEDDIAEGALLALFSNNASRIAYPTAECASNSEYTDSNFTTSNGWYWWLRTPYSSSQHYVRRVNTDGGQDSFHAYSGLHGVRPLCNLPGSLRVSESPNAAGNYTLLLSASSPEFAFTYTGDYTDRQITSNSENYRLLTLTSSGIFTPNQPFVGDIWMCGGGGNGATSSGNDYSGGGGAGGFVASGNENSFLAQEYSVVVGNARGSTSAFGYSANHGGSATNGDGASGGSGGGSGTVHYDSSTGWGDVKSGDAGDGDGISKIPFGDSENFQPHCAGGGGGARIVSMEVSGGNGGSNGANGSQGSNGVENGGSGGHYGGGSGGGNNNGEDEDGNDATYYGGGGGGSSEGGNSWPGIGGSGYQGVVYVRIKQ